jgi:hypothetical protein
MPRIRTLKPELWLSPQVMNLSHGARLLFLGLITQADDEGRGCADPRRLKAAIFPGDDVTSANVGEWLLEVEAQRLARAYDGAEHGRLYELPTWRSHQSIERPKPSRYPPSVTNQRSVGDASLTSRGGSEGSEGSEGSKGSDARAHDPVDKSGKAATRTGASDGLKTATENRRRLQAAISGIGSPPP